MAKPSYLKPSTTLPSIKTDLMSLDLDIDVLVWLGHSTLYMQLGGCRFLIDPVLISGSPVPFINKAFKGSDIYIPNDIPKIDYLLVTHDHFDHLDYKSVKSLKDKIGKVVCGLGVGEHFKRWKFDGSTIIELDWSDRIVLKNGSELFACPARHYSGRSSFGSDLALWVSFVIKIGGYTLFISGDSGYDKHFGEISKQFGAIDLAIIENGQYGHGWRDIHIMPDELLLAVEEIGAKKLFTVHNSKFALAQHGWIEPLDNIYKADKENGYGLMTPMIGEVVRLKDETQVFNNWWKTID
ncbi:MAG: MBL fold metallo-hydrolase [Eubacteriaceae bacterium]|nr:MBL fold metallo-hydrolase [Eubacteriaceae bacterium]